MKLDFDLTNCYGIKRFKTSFSFGFASAGNCIQLIYAPNGTMKTSFARTLKKYSEDKEIEDGLNPQRIGSCKIKIDSMDFPRDHVFVFDVEDQSLDSSSKVSDFLADEKTKERYDEVVSDLLEEKKRLIRRLKEISKSSDIEEELCEMGAANPSNLPDFFQVSKLIGEKLKQFERPHPFASSGLGFNELFDKFGKVRDFIRSNKGILRDYYEAYSSLLKNSNFYHFSGSGNSFGPYQAEHLAQDLKDGRFFAAEHALYLKGNKKIKTHKEFEELLKKEQIELDKDPELKRKFEIVSKKIDKNVELRRLKDIFEKYPPIVDELVNNFEELKEKILLSYIKIIEQEFEEFLSHLVEKEKEVTSLVAEADRQKEIWKEIVKIFNLRFHLPFEVQIENTKDIILKGNSAHLKFIYHDGAEQIEVERENLLKVLSRGERRAFFILQFLFEIYSRQNVKTEFKKYLLVLDDVVDSFDYQNKYAFIEYLQDIAESQVDSEKKTIKDNKKPNKILFMLFTHNYDFYRNVVNKLDLYTQPKDDDGHVWMARKTNTGIDLKRGQYVKNFFKDVVLKKVQKNPKYLIAAIPFLRNLSEYFQELVGFRAGLSFSNLTAYLHVKLDKDGNCITTHLNLNKFKQDLSSILQNKLNYNLDDENYLQNLKIECNEIEIKDNLKLEDKIVLSVGIRLLTEDAILSTERSLIYLLSHIGRNQTRNLYEEWEKLNKEKYKDLNLLFKRVFLVVNDNIHLNNFMLQPLIDAGSHELTDIYKKLSEAIPDDDFLGWKKLKSK